LFRRQKRSNLLKPASEEFLHLGMALAEFRLHLFPQGPDFGFGKGIDVRADSQSAPVSREKKWPEQHPCAVGVQENLGALNSGGFQNNLRRRQAACVKWLGG
jgi:hypothetical protein